MHLNVDMLREMGYGKTKDQKREAGNGLADDQQGAEEGNQAKQGDRHRAEQGRAVQKIEIARTHFIITSWPDKRWPVETVEWIEHLTWKTDSRRDNRTTIKKKNVVCARNTAIKVALNTDRHFEHFVFLDRDVRPTERTRRFLELDADVRCCQVQQRVQTAYSWPTSFHESIWATSRHVLEAIEPPWFMHRYTADGCNMLGCICQSFRDKVLEAGFSIAHGGWAEHDRDESWC